MVRNLQSKLNSTIDPTDDSLITINPNIDRESIQQTQGNLIAASQGLYFAARGGPFQYTKRWQISRHDNGSFQLVDSDGSVGVKKVGGSLDGDVSVNLKSIQAPFPPVPGSFLELGIQAGSTDKGIKFVRMSFGAAYGPPGVQVSAGGTFQLDERDVKPFLKALGVPLETINDVERSIKVAFSKLKA